MKNSGGRYGGAITAGLFLKQFIEEVREREKERKERGAFFFPARRRRACFFLLLFSSSHHAHFFSFPLSTPPATNRESSGPTSTSPARPGATARAARRASGSRRWRSGPARPGREPGPPPATSECVNGGEKHVFAFSNFFFVFFLINFTF